MNKIFLGRIGNRENNDFGFGKKGEKISPPFF